MSVFVAMGGYLLLAAIGERLCATRLSSRGEQAAAWWRESDGRPEATVELGPDLV